MHVREVLDEAVRCLAVSASPLQRRLELSGSVVMERLTPADFAFAEDRELFEQIAAALIGPSSSIHAPIGVSVESMSDPNREQVAGQILDLRDTIMGRAIRRSRLSSRR